ncbi:MAG: hypothetical protein KA536_11390 [Saprospiraceae bacterium]|nr:hypothetical protein [Saprospiraceae bacterium]
MFLYLDAKQYTIGNFLRPEYCDKEMHIIFGFTAFYFKLPVGITLPINPVLLQFGTSDIVIFNGVLEYVGKNEDYFMPSSEARGSAQMLKTERDNIFLVCTPEMDLNSDLKIIENESYAIANLTSLILGPNIVFEHIFSNANQIQFTKNKSHRITGTISLIPLDIKRYGPFIKNSQDELDNLYDKIEELSPEDKSKINSSLFWFGKSLSSRGVEKFIYIWISFETMFMPNSTDISHINILIEKMTGLERNQVKNNFQIGKIFGLRSNIVHNGLSPTFSREFFKYLELLFIDLFWFNLCGEKKGLLDNFITERNYIISKELESIIP